MQNSQYAINKLSEIKNVNGSLFNSCNFKEFIVDFNATGKSVEDINKELLDKKIFGGIDLSNTFKELGQVSLYSVTEVHSKEDIDNLVKAIKEILEP